MCRVAATPYPAYKTYTGTNRRPGKRSATGHQAERYNPPRTVGPVSEAPPGINRHDYLNKVSNRSSTRVALK